MTKTIGRFTYVLHGGPEDHTSPVVQICIKRWTEDEEGHVVISPHLMTAREIHGHIDALIKDLGAVRSSAKRALAAKLPH